MRRMRSILTRAVGLTAFIVAVAFLASVTSSARADEPNPYVRADDTWISISGTVASPTAELFTLD